MYSFLCGNARNLQECFCSIEQKTHLLVIEQKKPSEEYGRYIRLTGEQVKRIRQMFITGDFMSRTKPVNSFTLKDGVYTLCCRQENQVIRLSVEEMGHVFRYFEIHKERIAKFDIQFRSYKR
jgi:hypothetical protein